MINQALYIFNLILIEQGNFHINLYGVFLIVLFIPNYIPRRSLLYLNMPVLLGANLI